MRINKQFFIKPAEQLEKDWGKCCWNQHMHRLEGFSSQCPVCMIWLAYEIMKDLYDIDYTVKKSRSKKKKGRTLIITK